MKPNKVPLVDLRGYRCPLPVLKTRNHMRKLDEGECVEVLTDDPLAAIDIPNFCRESGQTLVDQENQDDGSVRFRLQRHGKL